MTQWPALDEHYTDEFGAIAPDVHAVAENLWPRAEKFALRILRDDSEGVTLLVHAAALVSRQRAEGRVIHDLSRYLYRTFCRLTLAQKKEDDRHKELERLNQIRLSSVSAPVAVDVEQEILIEELRMRMDPWTREVFDLRVLGHTFEEIAEMQNVKPATVRDRLRKNWRKLSAEIRRSD